MVWLPYLNRAKLASKASVNTLILKCVGFEHLFAVEDVFTLDLHSSQVLGFFR